MACALYNVIWGFQTLDEVRAATFDVGFPVFYESMVEACINPEVKELWPEPTSASMRSRASCSRSTLRNGACGQKI
jgi:hypothetical protein